MKVRAYNIKWDQDDGDTSKLPKEVIGEPHVYDFPSHCDSIEDSISEWLSNYISDEVGYCHNGFEWDFVPEKPTLTILPKRFTMTISKDFISVETPTKNMSDWDKVNVIVDEWANENNLKFVGAGTDVQSGNRDWSFKRPKRLK